MCEGEKGRGGVLWSAFFGGCDPTSGKQGCEDADGVSLFMLCSRDGYVSLVFYLIIYGISF